MFAEPERDRAAAPLQTLPKTTRGGLTSGEAARRLVRHGPDEIHRTAATSPCSILAAQLESPLIWLLLAACGISAALREIAEAGFSQEDRAERAMLALRSSMASERGGWAIPIIPVTILGLGKLAQRLRTDAGVPTPGARPAESRA